MVGELGRSHKLPWTLRRRSATRTVRLIVLASVAIVIRRSPLRWVSDGCVAELRAVVLRGRRDERAQLDGLRDGALAGRGGVLMLSGEAGVGKTALLEYAIASARHSR